MTSKLVDLINKLSEIYIEECRGCKERNKIKSVSDFIGLNKLDHNCNKCKKRWLTPISGLIKKFPNTYEFCNGDTNKFILLLRKNVYPYECIDNWERFDETLPEKKSFYSELYFEDTTDEDYMHAQKVFEEFNIKNLGEYQM